MQLGIAKVPEVAQRPEEAFGEEQLQIETTSRDVHISADATERSERRTIALTFHNLQMIHSTTMATKWRVYSCTIIAGANNQSTIETMRFNTRQNTRAIRTATRL